MLKISVSENFLVKIGSEIGEGNTLLLHGVTIPHGNGIVVVRLEIVGDTIGSPDLILPTIPFSNVTGQIQLGAVEVPEILLKSGRLVIEFLGKRRTATCTGAIRGGI